LFLPNLSDIMIPNFLLECRTIARMETFKKRKKEFTIDIDTKMAIFENHWGEVEEPYEKKETEQKGARSFCPTLKSKRAQTR